MSTQNKPSKTAPAWHAQVAGEINRDFAETNELSETARQRRARLGLMMIWVKSLGKSDGSIPHGKFRDWLEENCPAISARTASNYLAEGRSICDLLGWQNGKICHFDLPPHRLLEENPSNLSGDNKSRAKQLAKVIEGQAQFQALTIYKQVEIVDDELVAKVGRVKGEGGKRALTMAEQISQTQQEANDGLKGACEMLVRIGADWAGLPDDDLEVYDLYFDTWLKAKRDWVNTPPDRRDLNAMVARLKKGYG